MARPRLKVVTLTDAAAERVKAIMARSVETVAGLRVGVKKGGCAGMEYTMEYAAEAGPMDEVVEEKGVRLLIDPSAILFLLGTEMDYRSDKLSSGFVFKNPNQTGACGCGESVEIRPAQE
jgi:iron-sulfur cluster assembly protein